MLINGQPQDTILVEDRGLQYGDGLFETLAVVAGLPCLWDRHLARLEFGCKKLGFPPVNPQKLALDASKILAGRLDGVLKIIVTRGYGGRGYNPPQTPKSTRILSIHPQLTAPADWWHNGVQVRLCHTPISINSALAGLKHLNRLEQILARAEWDAPNIAEGLMCNAERHWISGTKTNLFLVQNNNCLLTPDLTHSGVAGVMRGLVLDCARKQGLQVKEGIIKTADLEQAQGIFLTNSLIGIWPVRELAGISYKLDTIPQKLRAACLQSIKDPSSCIC